MSRPKLPTELALASDGILYVNGEEPCPEGRDVFVGYALHPHEVAQLGVRALLAWAVLETIAFASDGRVYVRAGALEAEGRRVFRGFAATRNQAKVVVDEFHRTAFNLVIAARITSGRHVRPVGRSLDNTTTRFASSADGSTRH